MKETTSLFQRARLGLAAAALAVLVLQLAAVPAARAAGEQKREQVRNMLMGYEWSLNPAAFTQFGAGVDEALMALVSDPAPMPAYVRQRALVALRIYPNERVAQFLEGLVAGDPSKFLVRRAFESFSAAFSASQPARVEALAAGLLERADPHLRVTAAKALRALGARGSATANARLGAYLQSEPEAWVRRKARE